MGSNSPASWEASIVAVESLVYPLIATEWPTTPVTSIKYKKKETVQDHRAQKTRDR